MKFVELKKHLLTNNIDSCYLITGDDLFLKNSAIEMFYKYVINNNELSKNVFSTENCEPKKLIDSCNMGTFFGDRKVVVLKEYDNSKNVSLVEAIANYIKQPNQSTVLVIVQDDNTDTFKTIKPKVTEIDCKRLDRDMLVKWIGARLNGTGKSISLDATLLLIDYANNDLSKIDLELNKLLSYVDLTITPKDVEELVTKDLEFSIYELTDNLAKNNAEKVKAILDEMMQNKKTAPSVLGLIQSYFRRLFYVAVSSGTNEQIANELNVKEYAVKMAREQSSNFSKLTLKQVVEICSDLDFKVKTSTINNENAVNYLVMYILENNKRK